MKGPIGNTPPMGLTAELAKALREDVDDALDGLLREVEALHGASVREAVDEMRRWVERREHELSLSGRPECSCCGRRDTEVKPAGSEGLLCSACRTLYAPAPVVDEETPFVPREPVRDHHLDEDALPRKEPTNGHGAFDDEEDE